MLELVSLLELCFSNLFPRFLITTGRLPVDTNTQNTEEAISRNLHLAGKPVIPLLPQEDSNTARER
jgi:hypothetical protein